MKIDKKQIEHLAKLSRLEIKSDDEKSFTASLNDILKYVDQLKQVDVEGVLATTQIAGLKNNWREDEIEPIDEITRDEIKANIPEMEDDYIKVKRIL